MSWTSKASGGMAIRRTARAGQGVWVWVRVKVGVSLRLTLRLRPSTRLGEGDCEDAEGKDWRLGGE